MFMPGVTDADIARQPLLRQCFLWRGAIGRHALATLLDVAVTMVQDDLRANLIHSGFPLLRTLEVLCRSATGFEVAQMGKLLLLMAMYPPVRRAILDMNVIHAADGTTSPDVAVNAYIAKAVALESGMGMAWMLLRGHTREEVDACASTMGIEGDAANDVIVDLIERVIPPAPTTLRDTTWLVEAGRAAPPSPLPVAPPDSKPVSAWTREDLMGAALELLPPKAVAVLTGPADHARLPHVNSPDITPIRNHEAPRIQTLADFVQAFMTIMAMVVPDAHTVFGSK
jgi:hypothetical protein